jgi:hypothetical protein
MLDNLLLPFFTVLPIFALKKGVFHQKQLNFFSQKNCKIKIIMGNNCAVNS